MGTPSSPTRDQTCLLRDFAWNTHRQIVNTNKQGSLRLNLYLEPWAVGFLRQIE
jgi:hypothetical protein